MSITCYFSCPLCGIKKAPVVMDERGQDENITVFMDRVIRALSESHGLRSPWCHPKELMDVMIPAPSQGIGKPHTH